VSVRRNIFGGIAVAGVMVLILGLTGVFSSQRSRRAASVPADVGTPEGAPARMEVISKGFRATGKNWVVTAPVARMSAEEKAQLTDPKLVFEGEREGKKVTVTARSKEGVFTRHPKQHVVMSGDVVVRYVGEYTAELRTERLEADPEEARGWTDADVSVTLRTKEGTQTLTGTGATLDYDKRRGRVLKDIRAVLVGGRLTFPSGEGGAKKQATGAKPAPRRTTITADGPASADEMERTITVSNRVVIEQGKNTMTADKMLMRVSEDRKEIERFVAEGNVRLRGEEGSGRCDRITRDSSDGRVTLRGAPAVLEQAGNRVEAKRIELEPEAGGLFVPVAGRLTLAVEDEQGKASEPLNVEWGETMRMDRRVHEAMFVGDVRFWTGGQSIRSETLSVRFDETNRKIIEARAEGKVSLKGRMEALAPQKTGGEAKEAKEAEEITARSARMVYKPEEELVVFTGGARIERGNQVVRGENVALSRKDESVRVEGAGSMEGEQEGGQGRMKVAWGKGMRFSRATGKAVFDGGVSLEQSGRKMRAARLTATINEKNELKRLDAVGEAAEKKGGGKAVILEKTVGKDGRVNERRLEADRLTMRVNESNELESLVATGRAVIVDEGRTARGERIEVTGGGETIVMTGPGSLEGEDTSGEKPVKVKVEWADGMKYDRATGKAVFGKNVVVHHGERVMRASEVTAVLAERELRRLDARGDVVLTDSGQVARGDRLVWDMKKDLGSLRGEPAVIRQGTQRLFGDVIEFARDRGMVRIRSGYRVEGAIQARETLESELSLLPK